MKKAIYPLSADPITFGHIDIIKRALKIFDEVIVAVGENSEKESLFNLYERQNITQKALSHLQKIRVISFKGLLTDLAQINEIVFIVRGFRNSNDYFHELNLYQNYLSQNLHLEFINLFSSNNFISSSTAKEIVRLHGEVHKSVPLVSKQNLEWKISKQVIMGVSGIFGCGKSFLAKKLVANLKEKGVESSTIDLDDLSKELYAGQDSYSQKVQQKVLQNFPECQDSENKIDLKKLAEIVFADPHKLKILNSIIHPAIKIKLREKLRTTSGLIFLQSAILIEENLLYLCNNHLILVDSEDEIRRERLRAKGFSPQEIEARENHQLSFQEKYDIFVKTVDGYNFGKLWTVENNTNPNIKLLSENLLEYFNNELNF